MTAGRLPPDSVAGQQTQIFHISTGAAATTAVDISHLLKLSSRVTVRGPRVPCETACPRQQRRLQFLLRLSLEPECLENPTATAREDPQDGADSIRDTQAVCGFRCSASKHTPLFHTIKTMVAIFLAKVSRAISGRMPLANKAA
jgi:hypothetical protein